MAAGYFIKPISKARCGHNQPLSILEKVDPHLELGPVGGDHNVEASPVEGCPSEPFSSLVLTREGWNPAIRVRMEALLGYFPPYLFADRLLSHRTVHSETGT